MRRVIIILLIGTFIGTIIYMGCHHDKRVIDAGFEERIHSKPIVKDFEGCYRMIVDKDTSTLTLSKLSDTSYAGYISYHKYYVKKTTKIISIDSTKGRIWAYISKPYLKGFFKIHNDTAHAREIIFKIDGFDLVEGYGITDIRNDSIVFRRPANLEYDMSNPFKKIKCEN